MRSSYLPGISMRQGSIIALPICCALFTLVQAQTPCPADSTGVYANGLYGYRFTVPAGLKGKRQSPCSMYQGKCECIGDHGLSFDLGDGTILGVFSDYAAELEDPTPCDVLLAEMNRILGKETVPAAHITALELFQLKGRNGYRLEANASHDSEASRQRIEYVFYSGQSRNIIYLSAPKGHLNKGMQALKDVLRTWAWIPGG